MFTVVRTSRRHPADMRFLLNQLILMIFNNEYDNQKNLLKRKNSVKFSRIMDQLKGSSRGNYWLLIHQIDAQPYKTTKRYYTYLSRLASETLGKLKLVCYADSLNVFLLWNTNLRNKFNFFQLDTDIVSDCPGIARMDVGSESDDD